MAAAARIRTSGSSYSLCSCYRTLDRAVRESVGSVLLYYLPPPNIA